MSCLHDLITKYLRSNSEVACRDETEAEPPTLQNHIDRA